MASLDKLVIGSWSVVGRLECLDATIATNAASAVGFEVWFEVMQYTATCHVVGNVKSLEALSGAEPSQTPR